MVFRPELPSGDAQERCPIPPCDLEPCDLCSDGYGEFNDAAGMVICDLCMEEALDTPAFDARAEVGLVGRCGGRS